MRGRLAEILPPIFLIIHFEAIQDTQNLIYEYNNSRRRHNHDPEPIIEEPATPSGSITETIESQGELRVKLL